jgi:hypothetical protein
VPVVLYVVAVILAFTGLCMIVSAAHDEYRPRRRDLAERRRPFQPSIADEAAMWLGQHSDRLPST